MSLEDSILKQNIPGKYSGWSEEDDDIREGNEDPEPQVQQQTLPSIPEHGSTMAKRQEMIDDLPDFVVQSILAERSRKPQTGGKSVLADYKEYKKLESVHREYESMKRDLIVDRITRGVISDTESISISSQMQSNEEDDSFMAEYRRKRIHELQSLSGLPRFGAMIQVDVDNFIEMIDNENPRTPILVLVVDDSIPGASTVTAWCRELANRHPMIKFLHLNPVNGNLGLTSVALPAMLGYRRGDRTGCIVRVVDEVVNLCGVDGGCDGLEWVLEHNGMLKIGDEVQRRVVDDMDDDELLK